jgi:hypothetical protein
MKPLPVAKWIGALQQMNVHMQICWFLLKLPFGQAFSIAQCKKGEKKKYRWFDQFTNMRVRCHDAPPVT